MSAQPPLRLCHSGMDSHSLYAFEIFLSRINPGACRITDEEAADVAFIDIDTDLGPYLLEGHRLLYPSRPLIVSALEPGPGGDPLTIEVTKPVGLAAFSTALEQVRRLLQGSARGTASGPNDTVDDIPDEMQVEALRRTTGRARPGSLDPVALLRQLEERMSTFYVGSMPDVDLDDATARSAVFYAPEHFLQGEIARALAHARDIRRPIRLNDGSGTALFLDPQGGVAYQARSPNALRALAQLPTRGTVHMGKVESRDIALLGKLVSRPLEALEWDVALWASRGRLPRGTALDLPVRLCNWPNFTRLAVPPEAMRITGLWSRGGITLRETVRVLGIPQRYVFALYSACQALGLAEVAAIPSSRLQHLFAEEDAAPGAPPMRGLFRRLLGKLLGARLDDLPGGGRPSR